jgi:flagellar protein FlaG
MNIGAVNVEKSIAGASAAVAVNAPHKPVREAEIAAASSEHLRHMVEEMQRQISLMNVSLTFSTYGDHGEKVAIAVIDKENGEVIREIPPKEIQNLYSKMSELAGLIFNSSV